MTRFDGGPAPPANMRPEAVRAKTNRQKTPRRLVFARTVSGRAARSAARRISKPSIVTLREEAAESPLVRDKTLGQTS